MYSINYKDSMINICADETWDSSQKYAYQLIMNVFG